MIFFKHILIIWVFVIVSSPLMARGRSEAVSVDAPHIYIALGDSVSSGYGLTGYPALPEGNYPSLFFERLEYDGFVDEYHNMATSGFTTTMLLGMLNNISNDELMFFQNARVVSLNIGGNNILIPFREYLSDLQLASGTDTVRTGAEGALSGAWGVMHEIISGAGSVLSDSEETNFNVGGVIKGLGDILSGFREIIRDSRDTIAEFTDVVRGSPSEELEAIMEASMQIFSEDFSEIITWLKTNAPNATIIVNTIYNPIPPEILRVSVPISNWADALIEFLNKTIIEESKSKGFLVADIYLNLSNRSDLMNINLNPFARTLSFDIVHPNTEGHSLIAQLNYETLSQYTQ